MASETQLSNFVINEFESAETYEKAKAAGLIGENEMCLVPSTEEETLNAMVASATASANDALAYSQNAKTSETAAAESADASKASMDAAKASAGDASASADFVTEASESIKSNVIDAAKSEKAAKTYAENALASANEAKNYGENKASKCVPSTAGNAAGLDASGNLIDLGNGSGDAWKFTPAFGGSNKAPTNLLSIGTDGSTNNVYNQNGFVGTEDASTLTECPVTSGAFYAYRTVYPLKTDVGTKICVELKELYPSLGRTWTAVYQSNTASWTGWIENAGCAPKAPLMELNTTTKSSMDAYTEAGVYWINPSVTTDVPNNSWGILRVFVGGSNILHEFYAALNDAHAFRIFVNGSWQKWHASYSGAGSGNSAGWSFNINPDGSVDLWCRQTVTDWNCTYTLGDSGWYRSHPLPRPELPFTVTNQVTSATYLPTDGNGGVLWCLGQEGTGYCAQFYLVRHTSVAAINGVIEYHVHGTLNSSSSTSSGTKA